MPLIRVLPGLLDPRAMADFVEAAFDAVVVFDPQERVLYWNPAAEQMFGWSVQEALGKTAVDLFGLSSTGEEKKRSGERLLSLNQGTTLWGEHHPCRKDGSSLWVQYTARAILDAEGRITGYLTLYRDISVQMRLHEKEEQLKETNQRLNDILESIQDDFYVLDRDWNFIFASRLFTSKVGKEPDDFIGNNIWEMFPKHLGTTFEENLRAVLENQEIRSFEIPGKYTNAWYRIKAFPSAEGITILGTDISEHKQAGEALRKSEERYRHLVKYAPAAIYEIDLQTMHFTEVNDTMCQMLGYTRQELLSIRPEALLDEESRGRFRERMLKTLTGQEVSDQVEYRVRAKDGHDIWAVLNTTLNYSHGQPGSVSVIAYDITERKRREELSHALNVVNDSIHSTFNLNEVMQRATDQAASALGCDTAAISLQEGSGWVVRYVHGLPPDVLGMQMNDDEERHAVLAVQTKLPVVIDDAFNDERFNREHLQKWGVRSVLVVPLIIKGEARGVIFFNYQQSQNFFTDYQIDFAVKLSASLSLAMQNARLLDDLQRELAQRKRAEEELGELSQRLTYHVDNSPLAVIEWGSDMRLIRWSGAAERMFGWKAEEVLGKRIEDFRWIYEEDTRQVNKVATDLQTGMDSQRFSANRNYRKDGSVAFCEWYNSSLVDESGNLRSILSLVLDVTKRRQAEEALHKSERQLRSFNETLEQKVQEKTAQVRNLASDLVKAEQRERSRISHILHDDLQQRIYALQIELTFLHDGLRHENEAAHKKVSEIERQMSEIRQVIRHLSIELSPPILPEEGLSHALNWLAAHMQQQHGLPIQVEAEGSFALADEQIHVLLFNCVRELLFNVVKHAQASRAVVTLQWSDDGLRIEVRDDGKGFSVRRGSGGMSEEDELPSSFGLPTIRHQLSLFGGSMQINSAAGAGTRIILKVPVKQARRESMVVGEP